MTCWSEMNPSFISATESDFEESWPMVWCGEFFLLTSVSQVCRRFTICCNQLSSTFISYIQYFILQVTCSPLLWHCMILYCSVGFYIDIFPQGSHVVIYWDNTECGSCIFYTVQIKQSHCTWALHSCAQGSRILKLYIDLSEWEHWFWRLVVKLKHTYNVS